MNEKKRTFTKLLHDFKSPLSSSNIGLNYLLDGHAGELGKKAKEILSQIQERNEKLLARIERFEKENG